MDLVGSVEDSDVIIVDDMIDTAGTLCKAASVLKACGGECSISEEKAVTKRNYHIAALDKPRPQHKKLFYLFMLFFFLFVFFKRQKSRF